MNVRLTLYRINECGYYDHTGARLACSVQECLNDILAWSTTRGQRVADTNAYEGDELGNHLPVLFYSLRGDGAQSVLLTTFNVGSSINGSIETIDPNGEAGRTPAESVDIGEKLAGYTSHFWFFPEHERVFTVQLEGQRTNGMKGLSLFIRGFLARRSPHVVRGEDRRAGEVVARDILGHTLIPGSRLVHRGLSPRFETRLVRRLGDSEHLVQNAAKITHLAAKGKRINGEAVPDESITSFLKSLVVEMEPPRVTPGKVYETRVPVAVTGDQVREMVVNHFEHPEGTWDDIGFQIDGGQLVWISSMRVSHEYEINDEVRPVDQATADTALLQEALARLRPTALQLIQAQAAP